MKKRSHTSEQTQPVLMEEIPSALDGLYSDRVPRAALRGYSGITSWRPSAQLSAVERYGRFEILGRVGRGGMAEILLARERSAAGTLRHLVVKRILPEAADSDEMLHMFLAEARVVMGLSHPNLCQIYEVGEQEGTWFIAMEWVNGITLHQLIKRAMERKDLDYGVLARALAQCAEALHHAHTARDGEGKPLHLVHRDVSPHNLMVAFDGRVKLLDFGIAKSTASTHHTETGVVKGKVCYMAPEQWLSDPLDSRTDVFALGACLYEALTGRIVFRRDTQSEVMKAIVQEPEPPLAEVAPEVPAALAEIAHRALAKDPAERFQSALEMSEALERFVGSLPEPVSTARIAGYARRLFASEVALGPVLERAVRGAQILPALLPPLSTGLIDLLPVTVSDAAVALPGLAGGRLPSPPPLPAPAEPVPTPSIPPLSVELDGTDVDALAPFGFEPVESKLEPANDTDVDAAAHRPATFSDAPTRPLPGLASDRTAEQPQPRLSLPTRTISMHVGRRRRLAVALVAVAAGALLGVLGHNSLRTQRARAIRTTVLATAAPEQQPAAATPVSEPALVEQAPALAPPPEQPAPVPVAVDPPAGKAKPSATVNEGLLSINTRPWSTVYLGKRVLGTTPLADVPVPRGPLVLKLVDRDGRVYTKRIAGSREKARSAFFDFETKP